MFHRCKTEHDIEKIYEMVIDLCEGLTYETELVREILKESRDIARKKLAKETHYIEVDRDVDRCDPRIKILGDLAKYAKNNPRFSVKYIFSVYDHLKKNGTISKNQYNALVKIYYHFRLAEEITNEEIYIDDQFRDLEKENPEGTIEEFKVD